MPGYLFQYSVLVPSRLEPLGLPTGKQNPGFPVLIRICNYHHGNPKDNPIGLTDPSRWLPTIWRYIYAAEETAIKKFPKTKRILIHHTNHVVITTPVQTLFVSFVSSFKQGAEGSLIFMFSRSVKGGQVLFGHKDLLII